MLSPHSLLSFRGNVRLRPSIEIFIYSGEGKSNNLKEFVEFSHILPIFANLS